MGNFFFQPNGIGEVHVQSMWFQWMQIIYQGQTAVTLEKSGRLHVLHILILMKCIPFGQNRTSNPRRIEAINIYRIKAHNAMNKVLFSESF